MGTPTAQTLHEMDTGANIVLRSENFGGNLHETVNTINKEKGLAQYVLMMDCGSPYTSTLVVFRGPAIVLDFMLMRKKG
jgi:hypothetical protein